MSELGWQIYARLVPIDQATCLLSTQKATIHPLPAAALRRTWINYRSYFICLNIKHYIDEEEKLEYFRMRWMPSLISPVSSALTHSIILLFEQRIDSTGNDLTQSELERMYCITWYLPMLSYLILRKIAFHNVVWNKSQVVQCGYLM